MKLTILTYLLLLLLPLPLLAQETTEFGNPIVFESIQGLVTALVQALVVMLIPVVVFFIIFAGFKYVTARGNPNDIKTANLSLLYAAIGGVIILGAFAIIEIVEGTVSGFRQ